MEGAGESTATTEPVADTAVVEREPANWRDYVHGEQPGPASKEQPATRPQPTTGEKPEAKQPDDGIASRPSSEPPAAIKVAFGGRLGELEVSEAHGPAMKLVADELAYLRRHAGELSNQLSEKKTIAADPQPEGKKPSAGAAGQQSDSDPEKVSVYTRLLDAISSEDVDGIKDAFSELSGSNVAELKAKIERLEQQLDPVLEPQRKTNARTGTRAYLEQRHEIKDLTDDQVDEITAIAHEEFAKNVGQSDLTAEAVQYESRIALMQALTKWQGSSKDPKPRDEQGKFKPAPNKNGPPATPPIGSSDQKVRFGQQDSEVHTPNRYQGPVDINRL